MTGPREIARAELVRDHRGFEDAAIEQIARQREIAGLFHPRIAARADPLAIPRFAAPAIPRARAARAGTATAAEQARLGHLPHHRRHPTTPEPPPAQTSPPGVNVWGH